MDEDRFNIEVRKFLKRVGVTSQRDIERAVEQAIAEGRLRGDETLHAGASVTIPELDLTITIAGDINLQ